MKMDPKTESRQSENHKRMGYMKEEARQIYKKKISACSNPIDNYFFPGLHKRSWWPNGKYLIKRRYQYGEIGLQHFYEKNNVEQRKDIYNDEDKKKFTNYIRDFKEYEYANENDYILTIEYCSNCNEHQSITQHSSEMYRNLALNYQKIIRARFPFIKIFIKPVDVDIVKEKEYKLPHLVGNGKGYEKSEFINDQFKECRIGAFEIQLYNKKLGKQIIHSKLFNKNWPKVENVIGKILTCLPSFDLNLILYDKEDYTEKEKMNNIQVNIYYVNDESYRDIIDNINEEIGVACVPSKRYEMMKTTQRLKKEGLYLNNFTEANAPQNETSNERLQTFSGKSNTSNRLGTCTSIRKGGDKINCDLATLKGKMLKEYTKFTKIENEEDGEDKDNKNFQDENYEKNDEKNGKDGKIMTNEQKDKVEENIVINNNKSNPKNNEIKTKKSKKGEFENVHATLTFPNLKYNSYIIETIENSNFQSSLTLLTFNSIEYGKKDDDVLGSTNTNYNSNTKNNQKDKKGTKNYNSMEEAKKDDNAMTNNQRNKNAEKVNAQIKKYIGLYHQTKAIIEVILYTEEEKPKDTNANTENATDTDIQITERTSSTVILTNIQTLIKYQIEPNSKKIYRYKTEPGTYKIEITDKKYEKIEEKILLKKGYNQFIYRLKPERRCDIKINVFSYELEDKENEENDYSQSKRKQNNKKKPSKTQKKNSNEKKDKNILSPLQNVEISILNKNNEEIDQGITDKDGYMLYTADTNIYFLKILVTKSGYYPAERFFSRNKELILNNDTLKYEINMSFVLVKIEDIQHYNNIILVSYMNCNKKLFDLDIQYSQGIKANKRTVITDLQEQNGLIISKFDWKDGDEELESQKTTNKESENNSYYMQGNIGDGEDNIENQYEEICRVGLIYHFEEFNKDKENENKPPKKEENSINQSKISKRSESNKMKNTQENDKKSSNQSQDGNAKNAKETEENNNQKNELITDENNNNTNENMMTTNNQNENEGANNEEVEKNEVEEDEEEEIEIDMKEKVDYLNSLYAQCMLYTPYNKFSVSLPNNLQEVYDFNGQNQNMNENEFEDTVNQENNFNTNTNLYTNSNNNFNTNSQFKSKSNLSMIKCDDENNEGTKKKYTGIIWDLGWIDMKHRLFYETSVFFPLENRPIRQNFFEDWIEFLQKVMDEKIYKNLFEYFDFQHSYLTGTDRLQSKTYFNTALFNLLKNKHDKKNSNNKQEAGGNKNQNGQENKEEKKSENKETENTNNNNNQENESQVNEENENKGNESQNLSKNNMDNSAVNKSGKVSVQNTKANNNEIEEEENEEENDDADKANIAQFIQMTVTVENEFADSGLKDNTISYLLLKNKIASNLKNFKKQSNTEDY